jgi:hypothetical protein
LLKGILKELIKYDHLNNFGILGQSKDFFAKEHYRLLNLDGAPIKNGCLQMLFYVRKDKDLQFISTNQE